jgi:hypothetical protein
MSIKTTHNIDRLTAITVILDKVQSCSNSQLEEMLESFDESLLRNYLVRDRIPDGVVNYVIKSVEDFNNTYIEL